MQNQGTTSIHDVQTRLPQRKQAELTRHLSKQDGVRDARFSDYVSRAMKPGYASNQYSAQPIRKRVYEQLDTDGPATCLVYF